MLNKKLFFLSFAVFISIQMNAQLDSTNFQKLIEFSKATHTDEFLLIQNNKTIGHWKNSSCDSTTYNTASMVKSWTSIVVGTLIDKGYVSSENDLVCKYLPEWEEGCKQKVTIKHLLTMSAGFKRKSGAEGILDEVDMNQYALNRSLDNLPDMKFGYSNTGVQLLGILIEKVTQKTANEYFKEVLFEPLEMKSSKLMQDATGNDLVYGGTQTSVEDAAKIGLLLLNKGKYRDQRIVSEDWIKKMVIPSDKAAYYGYLWWIDNNSQNRSYAATGDGGKLTIVFPDLNLLYVRRQSCNLLEHGNMSKWMGPKFLELVANAIDEEQIGLTMKLTNGKWFDGETFIEKTVWVKNGTLSFKKVASIDTTIDLAGKYVIPPFAEAHNHNLESDYKLEERIDSYLDNGVFYVKLLSSIKKRIAPLMHHYNKPDRLDVSMAHAPLTATDGHPIGVRKRYLERGHFDGLFNSLEELESHGYYTIDNIDNLEHKWDQILSFSPDFIKLNLLHSEEYEKRKNDVNYFARKGLNPKLIPKIVAKAHQSNLRVSAHVETAYDFHIAVEAGVDEIAHLPEISHGKPINREDAKLAKKKGIVVVTTTSLVTKRKENPNYKELVENISSNLRMLKEEKVTLAIGSDMYNDNSVGEFEFLYDLNIFSNLELLKMWCENAAITTFPNRKIGYLKEGYEASFLVLDRNPIEDMSSINEAISLSMKQGILLE